MVHTDCIKKNRAKEKIHKNHYKLELSLLESKYTVPLVFCFMEVLWLGLKDKVKKIPDSRAETETWADFWSVHLVYEVDSTDLKLGVCSPSHYGLWLCQ